jgi:2,4-diketo-3-deoxy-L-fuconate hydrolase
MRLVRFGSRGKEMPGVLDGDGKIRDLSGVISDIDGSTLSPERLTRLRSINPSTLPLVADKVRIGACVANVPNLLAIGLNYSDHAAEANMAIPTEPVVFNKHTSSICGPNDPLITPPESQKLDWEVEIAFVMGRPCWHVTTAEALSYVAGYFVCNDVSEREYQLEKGGQWTKGKSYANFAPIGPWIVTSDEIPDPQTLGLWLDVNGQRFQTGNTGKMIFTIAEIVSYLSRHMQLVPGDVVTTGTPPGVGLGKNPPVFLKIGDTVRLGIDRLGTQEQTVVAFKPEMAAAFAGSHST